MSNVQIQASAAQLIGSERPLLGSEIDVPTLAVALAIYVGYAAVTYFFQDMPRWVAAPLGALLLTWYGSLQHETIHDHPTPWRRLNMGLASLPLSLWIPYRIYRATHLQHHRHGGRRLTDTVHDPESFYARQESPSRFSAVRRALRAVNCTLAGRLTVGPALSMVRFWMSEANKALAGDRRRRIIWVRHAMAASLVLVWTHWVCHIPVHVYLMWVVYPSISLTHLRSFAEHRAHPQSARRTVTVEANPFWALLFLNNNLHIAHHVHPRLAWYLLPQAWRLLRSRALDAGLVIEGGYGQVMRDYLTRPVISIEHPGPGGEPRR